MAAPALAYASARGVSSITPSRRRAVVASRRASAPSKRRLLVVRNADGESSKAAKKKGKSGLLFGRETTPPLPPSLDDDDDDFDSPACAIAFASCDNESHPTATILTVTVSVVPGVMRILSWLLNGLDLDVNEAEWVINEEEGSTDESPPMETVDLTMQVTEGRGKYASKVKDTRGLEDRLSEYLRFCTQAERKYHPVIEHGGIKIDNEADPETTLLTVSSSESGARSMLYVSSTITGLGLKMNRAKLLPASGSDGSVWNYNLTVFETNGKLTNAQMQGLLYTLCLVFNTSSKSATGSGGAGDYLVEKMVGI